MLCMLVTGDVWWWFMAYKVKTRYSLSESVLSSLKAVRANRVTDNRGTLISCRRVNLILLPKAYGVIKRLAVPRQRPAKRANKKYDWLLALTFNPTGGTSETLRNHFHLKSHWHCVTFKVVRLSVCLTLVEPLPMQGKSLSPCLQKGKGASWSHHSHNLSICSGIRGLFVAMCWLPASNWTIQADNLQVSV